MKRSIRSNTTRFVRRRRALSIIQLGFALLGLAGFSGNALGEQVVDADNIVVVLDASGSMRKQMSGAGASRMAVAKSALQEVVKQLPDETNLGLLVFGAAGQNSSWVYPLGPMDLTSFSRQLSRIAPRGGTPLGQYIMLGANRLLEQREAQNGYGTYRLIVITDGEANDSALVERYTPQTLARGITVEVIGVDMKATHSLARQVHTYRRGDDPKSLTQALVSSIAEVSFDQNDTAGDEGFEIIAALPDAVASAALTALRQSGNEPIGAQPKPTPSASISQPVSPAPSTAPRPIPDNSTKPDRNGGALTGTVFTVVIVAVIIRIFLSVAKRGLRG